MGHYQESSKRQSWKDVPQMKELKELELLVKQRDYDKHGGEHSLCSFAMFFRFGHCCTEYIAPAPFRIAKIISSCQAFCLRMTAI